MEGNNISNTGIQKQYQCSVCQQVIDESNLPVHLLIHLEGKLSQCNLCVLGFKTMGELTQHLTQHIGNILYAVISEDLPANGRFNTKYEYSSSKESNLTIHESMHIDDNLIIGKHSNQDASMPEADLHKPKLQKLGSIKVEESELQVTESSVQSLTCEGGKEFDTEKDLQRHRKESHTSQSFFPLKCTFCSENLFSEEEREEHRKSTCKICGSTFCCRGHLKVHEATHSGQVQHKCDICGMVFINEKVLSDHKLNGHKWSRKCKYCKKLFYSPKSLQYHQEWEHKENMLDPAPSTSPLYSGEICGAKFTMQSNLQDHKLLEHNPTKTKTVPHKHQSLLNLKLQVSHICKSCSLTFSSVALLKSHQDQAHNDNGLGITVRTNSSTCTLCERKFETKQALEEHNLITHHCSGCGKDFKHRGVKENHQTAVCKICGAAVVCKTKLRAHIDTAHKKKLLCTHCGMHFDNIHEKYKHYNTKCKICGRIFTCMRLLLTHETSHAGEVPHRCEVCGQGFYGLQSLKKHQQLMHKDFKKVFLNAPTSKSLQNEHQKVYKPDIIGSDKPEEACVCKLCMCHFVSTQALQTHMKVHKPYYHCVCCGKDFYSEPDKVEHTNCHCKVCGKAFVCKTRFASHEASNCGKVVYHCKYCGVDLYTASDKDSHRNAECMTCGRVFLCHSLLTPHEASHITEGPHKCELCGKIFDKFQALSTHQEFHRTKYKCQYCDKKFSNALTLKSHQCHHVLSSTVLKKTHHCIVCTCQYETEPELCQHMQTHKANMVQNKSPGPCTYCQTDFENEWEKHEHKSNVKCTICGKLFICGGHLNTHAATHSGELPYKCDICGLVLLHSKALGSHMKRFHSELHRCKHCGKTFSRVFVLKKHQDKCLAHNIKPTHICSQCGKSFQEKGLLTMHKECCQEDSKRMSGNGEKESLPSDLGASNVSACSTKNSNTESKHWICTTCSETLKGAKELAEHLETHKTPTLSCTRCTEYTCDTQEELRIHMKSHQDLNCKYCNKTFSDALTMKSHQCQENHALSSTDLKKTHHCSICTCQYETEPELSQHMQSHKANMVQNKSPRPCTYCQTDFENDWEKHAHRSNIKCTICGKSFLCGGHLTAHTSTHAGKVPYKCDICGLVLLNSKALEAHMKRFHLHKVHMCKHCGKTLSRAFELKKHEDKCLAHMKKITYVYSQCGNSFYEKPLFTIHKEHCKEQCIKMLGNGEKEALSSEPSASNVSACSTKNCNNESKPWICTTCSETFKGAKELAEHLETHKTPTLSCTRCTEFTCDTQEELRIHMKSHQDLKCDNCGREFQNDLQKHKHADLKCKFCGIVFTCRSQMTAHEALHDAEVYYKCDECYEVFTQKLALAKHKHIHHKITCI